MGRVGGGAASSARPPSLAGAQHLMELYVAARTTGCTACARRRCRRSAPSGSGGKRSAALASGAAAALNADGLAQVFAIGPDRAVWHRRQLFTAG